jgi:GH24 family phage-related lysozyme (muramidase)
MIENNSVEQFRSDALTPGQWYQDYTSHMARQLAKHGFAPASSGITKEPSAAPITDAAGAVRSLTSLMDTQRQRKGPYAMENEMIPTSETYKSRRYDWFVREEGVRLAAYDDGVEGAGPNGKGYRTVGVGFNMDTPGHREVFKKTLGVDDAFFDAVYAGKASITRDQAKALFEVKIQDGEKLLESRFGDINLSDNQRMSLLSLAYNGTSLIGPKITAAVRSRNWQGVVDEILYNSNGGKSKGLRGIPARRWREATMFAGPNSGLKIPAAKDYLSA